MSGRSGVFISLRCETVQRVEKRPGLSYPEVPHLGDVDALLAGNPCEQPRLDAERKEPLEPLLDCGAVSGRQLEAAAELADGVPLAAEAQERPGAQVSGARFIGIARQDLGDLESADPIVLKDVTGGTVIGLTASRLQYRLGIRKGRMVLGFGRALNLSEDHFRDLSKA